MAYIRRRGKRSWEITVTAGSDPETGKPIRIRRTVKGTKEDAERVAVEMEAQAGLGPVRRLTVGELIEEWLRHVRTHRQRRTYESYARNAERIREALGPIQLDRLRPADIQRWIDRMHSQGARRDGRPGGLSVNSISQHHRALRAALSYAERMGWVQYNPAKRVVLPLRQKPTKHILTREQVAAILQAVEGTRWHALFWLAAHGGLRIGELGGLWWEEIDWDEPALRLQRALKRGNDGKHFMGDLKDREGRIVYLRQRDMEVLEAHRSRQEIERRMAPRWRRPEHVFTQPDGDWLDLTVPTKKLKKVCRSLGLPEITMHDLRHIHGSHLLQYEGWDLAAVSERLGHSSIAFTAETYIHVLDSAQKRYIKRMDGRAD